MNKLLADRLKRLTEQQLHNLLNMLKDQQVPNALVPPELSQEVEDRAKKSVQNLINKYLDNVDQPLVIVPNGLIK